MDKESISKILGRDYNNEAIRLITQADEVYDNGNLNLALELYDRALKVDNNNWYLFYKKGNVKEDQKELDIAIKYYRKSIELEDSYIAYFRIGSCYLLQEKFNKALKNLNTAISKYSENDIFIQKHRILNNRASCLIRLNKHQEAIKDCNEAIQLAPNYSNAYSNRGIAFMKNGKIEQAFKDLEKAKNLGDPRAGQLIQFLKSKL